MHSPRECYFLDRAFLPYFSQPKGYDIFFPRLDSVHGWIVAYATRCFQYLPNRVPVSACQVKAALPALDIHFSQRRWGASAEELLSHKTVLAFKQLVFVCLNTRFVPLQRFSLISIMALNCPAMPCSWTLSPLFRSQSQAQRHLAPTTQGSGMHRRIYCRCHVHPPLQPCSTGVATVFHEQHPAQRPKRRHPPQLRRSRLHRNGSSLMFRFDSIS
jgi:hypothetical protein